MRLFGRRPEGSAGNPQVRVVRDSEMRQTARTSLNRLCDISDWRSGRFLEILRELNETPFVHRKAWEYAMCIWGLEKLGVVRENAAALAVGAGYERPLYYFANKIRRMVATDLYEGGGEGNPEMLRNPVAFAPIEYRHDHLEVLQMDGCDLRFDQGVFDFAFCLSSIEHFGRRQNVAKAMREMARVLKPDGAVCITTEYILNEGRHAEYFTHAELFKWLIDASDLRLVETELDLRISESLLLDPIDLARESELYVAPHIVLKKWGVVWTSLSLFFRKP
jgi:SAM-dependent methyltransferase